MLVIRREQMQVFEAARFSAWLEEHLYRFFPERSLELGPNAMRRAMAELLTRARGYGFREPADLCRFVDIAFALGLGFDRNPELPWAAELLDAPEIADATERMDLLTAAAKTHLRSSAGTGAPPDA